MTLSNKVYDMLKWITLNLLPAIAALYFGLAKIWELPYAENIVGTISLIVTFLGAVLSISSEEYKKKQAQFIKLNGGDTNDNQQIINKN